MKAKTLQDKRPHALRKSSPPVEPKCEKISISLFPADIERTNLIREFVHKERRIFINRSQAIRLALKIVPISEEMFSALEAVQQEESRKS